MQQNLTFTELTTCIIVNRENTLTGRVILSSSIYNTFHNYSFHKFEFHKNPIQVTKDISDFATVIVCQHRYHFLFRSKQLAATPYQSMLISFRCCLIGIDIVYLFRNDILSSKRASLRVTAGCFRKGSQIPVSKGSN